MTKVEFDDLLRRAGCPPEDFWTEFHKQKRQSEKALERVFEAEGAADFIDNGLSWASTPQGHEYWERVKRTVAKLPPKPYITCCIWNGHPLFCNCPTKQRWS